MMNFSFNQVLFSATEIDCNFCLHAQKGSTLSEYVFSEKKTSIMNNQNYLQGQYCSGESACFPPLWPGCVTCGLSLLLVRILALRVFLQISSLQKYQHSKFKFDLEIVDKKSHLVECPLLNSNFIIPFLLVQSQCVT